MIEVGNSNNPTGRFLSHLYYKQTGININTNYTAMGWWNEKNGIKNWNAVALFDNYTGNNIDIHIWAERMSLDKIRAVYRYVFDQLGCTRLSGKIPSNNKKLLQLLPRFDFEYECTLKGYVGTVAEPIDLDIYKISSDRARKWIRYNGCAKPASAA